MNKEFKPKRTKEEIVEALVDAKSIKDVIINLGLRAAGGNFKSVKKWILHYELEIPIFDKSQNMSNTKRQIPLEEVFCENSLYTNRNRMKKMLVKYYDWEYKCHDSECPNPEPVWKGKPLVIQLEHKNGVSNDNRIENLEFLCPNCHTQTSTYAGRSKTKIRISPLSQKQIVTKQQYDVCPKVDCDEIKNVFSAFCKIHGPGERYANNWPEDEKLLELVELHGWRGTAKIIGTVSDNAVKKRVNKIKDNA